MSVTECHNLHILGRTNIIDFENHLDKLGSKLDLRLLGMEGLDY